MLRELKVLPQESQLFAVTGGTGFIGGHLTRSLLESGHRVVLIARGLTHQNADLLSHPQVSFQRLDLSTADNLGEVLRGCAGVAHCAGINRENVRQSFTRVHVEGTRRLVTAARQAGVKRLALLSYLGARPGPAYHESKWQAEEIVRQGGLDYAVLRAGLNYGTGDHFLNHLNRVMHTFPVLPLVGMGDVGVRPVAIADLIRVLRVALLEDRLVGRTLAVVGPDEITLTAMIERVGRTLGKRTRFFHLPVWVHRLLATVFERIMKIPIVSRAQVEILAEGLSAPALACDPLPGDLAPRLPFDPGQIQGGLSKRKPKGLSYCLVCIAKGQGRSGRCPMRDAEADAAFQ